MSRARTHEVAAVLAILGVLLARTAFRPRITCEGTDEGHKYATIEGGARWLGNVGYRVLPPPKAMDITTLQLSRAAAAAFGTWDREADDIAIYEDRLSRNTVGFARIDGAGGTVAATNVFLDDSMTKIVGFRILLDQDEEWGVFRGEVCPSLTSDRRYDMQNVLTHEVGHALGLRDVNGRLDGGQTMYGSPNKGETLRRSLSQGDVAGINALYR